MQEAIGPLQAILQSGYGAYALDEKTGNLVRTLQGTQYEPTAGGTAGRRRDPLKKAKRDLRAAQIKFTIVPDPEQKCCRIIIDPTQENFFERIAAINAGQKSRGLF